VSVQRIGVIAGAFNPVTRAHVALAEAARVHVDELVFAIPREFPHKEFSGASLDHRIEMLRRVCEHSAFGHPLCEARVEITDGGLFIDIAREVRRSRPDSEIFIVCGRDAAERMVAWNYDEPRGRPNVSGGRSNDSGALERIFQEMHLLVADRQGAYHPPDHLRTHIHSLALPPHFDDISSSEIRRRMAAGEPWEHFVPETIVDLVRKIYGALEIHGSRSIL
jgi:nicotinate-nucleotide adenylyltransferase